MSKLELKIIPPLVTAIFALLMWSVTKITPEYAIFGQYKTTLAIIILSLGIFIMLVAAAFILKAKTTINPMRPDKSSSLVTSGLYKFSRNPIYLADFIILIAFGVYLSNIFSFIIMIGFIFYMNKFQVKPEERFLEEKFGTDYLTFKAQVRRWI